MSEELPSIHPVIANKSDFSDRLSPMIVKELRQGLRTKTFVALFLGLQILLAFIILLATSSASYDRAGSIISGVILFLFSLATLIFQPLRGVSAVSNEIKENTIDLMALTKLSAWKIVYGKWLSIVSQSALLFVTVIPYLVLRYFFGGMELFSELLMLVSIFIFSAVLTALTVGMSTNTTPLIRWIPPIVGIPVLLYSMLMMMALGRFGRSFGDFFALSNNEDRGIFFGTLSFGVYLGYYFLDMGATAIAPMAENRATRKRIIGSIALLAVMVGFGVFVDEDSAIIFGSLICLLLGLDVLTERKEFASSVVRPFVKRGPLGKLAGRFLYPGWPTGVIFFGFLALIMAGTGIFLETDADVMGFAAIIFYSTIAPSLLARLFEAKIKNLFAFHIIVWFASLIVLGVVGVIGGILSNDALYVLLAPLPFGGFVLFDTRDYDYTRDYYLDDEGLLILFTVLFVAAWLICLIRAIPNIMSIIRAEHVIRISLSQEDSSSSES